jgi:hypothetical protein
MSQKRQRVFTSPREVFQTYFPKSTAKEDSARGEGYDSHRRDLVGKLAEDFAASLRKKARQ